MTGQRDADVLEGSPATAEPDAHGATAGRSPAYARGGSVVCIPVQTSPDVFALCLASVVEHTPVEVPVIVAELGVADPAIAEIVSDGGGTHQIVHLAPSDETPAASVAAAIAQAEMADVALLHSGCVVGPGWHDRLRSAAYADSHAASASALSNDAGILSVPERNVANRLREDLSVDAASATVAAHAAQTRPRIPMAVFRAVYLRRDALGLTGGLDGSFVSIESAVIDFSQRCLAMGLVHIAADDVFVFFHSSGKLTADGELRPREALADPLITRRYPFFSAQLGESELAIDRPLPAGLARARRALNGMSVTIDGRSLVAPQTGTHVIVLETIRALAALKSLDLRVIVPHDLARFAREGLVELDVTLVEAGSDLAGLQPSDVVHRPFQVFSSADLSVLRPLGDRLVITHLDLIAYDNASYFPSFAHWQHHRMVTRLALSLADRVVFLSQDAATEAVDEQLVEASRAAVVYPGVTYSYSAGAERSRPAGMERFADQPFMVSVGADLHHKNRVFALELVAQMRRTHGWNGAIVFAGPRANCGSSAGEEARLIAGTPDLADAVLTLPWVSEPEKAWLLENAVAVCHPSTREGLGLMPFEAAAYGRPCIFASTTALAELQPPGSATIVPWDASASAARVMALLGDPQALAAHVTLTRERAQQFTWTAAAEQLLENYETAMSAPTREARRIATELLVSDVERDDVHRKYDELWEGMSKDGQLLVRPDGLLDAEDQRAVLTVVTRPWLRRIVLGQARLIRKLTRNPTPLPEPPTTSPEDFDLHFREDNLAHMAQRRMSETNLSDLY